MEIIQNLIEYYDELYPVSDSQKKFYNDLCDRYSKPVKFLRVGCGAGLFEHTLAREGHDVTGIETYPEILRSANLRRRNQLMSIRFFQMSYLDMTRFLGKNFYNIISCLEDRIIFIHDKTLLRKFFFDCYQLLTKDGILILNLYNYSVYNKAPVSKLPVRESLRSKLLTEINYKEDGKPVLFQNVETGNGKLLPIHEDTPVYPILPQEIETFAMEAGFKSIKFYADWNRNPFTGKEESLVVEIS